MLVEFDEKFAIVIACTGLSGPVPVVAAHGRLEGHPRLQAALYTCTVWVMATE